MVQEMYQRKALTLFKATLNYKRYLSPKILDRLLTIVFPFGTPE